MVEVQPKPGNNLSLSKQVSKKMASDHKGDSKANDPSFTAEWFAVRREIMEVLSFYRGLLVNRKLLEQLEDGKCPEAERRTQYSGLRFHMRVARVLKSLGKWVDTGKQIGHVPGIKVGDEFLWRGELSLVGLHHEYQKGIACVKSITGKIMASSIVESGRYGNIVWINSDKLVYCGEGKKAKDQKLVGGNLALKNSMDEKMPVRVIRRFKDYDINNGYNYKFVYLGLYRVTEYWKEKGQFGACVFKFSLRKYWHHLAN